MGNIKKLVISNTDKLYNKIIGLLSNICKECGFKFKNYLTPDINLQDDNPDLCFMWTTWLELLILLNENITGSILAQYINFKYNKQLLRTSRKRQMILFANYLNEIKNLRI